MKNISNLFYCCFVHLAKSHQDFATQWHLWKNAIIAYLIVFLVLLAKNQTRFCHRVVNINKFFNLLLTFWIRTHVGTCAEHYTIFLLFESNSNMGCESLSRYLAHLVKVDVIFCHHLAYIFSL